MHLPLLLDRSLLLCVSPLLWIPRFSFAAFVFFDNVSGMDSLCLFLWAQGACISSLMWCACVSSFNAPGSRSLSLPVLASTPSLCFCTCLPPMPLDPFLAHTWVLSLLQHEPCVRAPLLPPSPCSLGAALPHKGLRLLAGGHPADRWCSAEEGAPRALGQPGVGLRRLGAFLVHQPGRDPGGGSLSFLRASLLPFPFFLGCPAC